MRLSKKLKKSSAATCSHSNNASKQLLLLAALLALPLASTPARAAPETGVVTAVGTGHETSEAIANLLRTTLDKYFKDEPANFKKAVTDREILPNASSFVQSYRLLDSAKGTESLSASVDLDVIRGLLSLTPAKMSAPKGTKALVVVRGAHFDSMNAPKAGNPYVVLENAAKDRLERRDFTPVVVSADELPADAAAGEDVIAPEALRALGNKEGARVAIGIAGKRETFENENSHNHDERLVLNAILIDVKSGAILGRASTNVSEPKARRDQFLGELQRMMAEDSKDLFQDLFVTAGRKVGPVDVQDDFSVVRLQFPSNPELVGKFRSMLEANHGLQSVTEYSVRRGAFDFAVRPPMKGEALSKLVSGLSTPDLTIAVQPPAIAEPDERQPDLVVKVGSKDARNPSSVGEASEDDMMKSEDAMLEKPEAGPAKKDEARASH